MGVYDCGPLKLALGEKETTIIHSYRFVMELLHWYKVCEPGGDKLHRSPVVALIVQIFFNIKCTFVSLYFTEITH